MTYTLNDLNQMTQAEFTAALGEIFEHTPAIATQAWEKRPFTSLDNLHQTMVNIVQSMPQEQQLVLIRAHPDLGSRAAMADASVKEQAGAGLNQLTPDEFHQLQTLNQRYTETFQFPFILAVKGHTKASILQSVITRLNNDPDIERTTALTEIAKIARFRLNDLLIDG